MNILPQVKSKAGGNIMSQRDGFSSEESDESDYRVAEASMAPGIEVWPGEGDFSDWIAYHVGKERLVICSSPEFRASPFCGIGYH